VNLDEKEKEEPKVFVDLLEKKEARGISEVVVR